MQINGLINKQGKRKELSQIEFPFTCACGNDLFIHVSQLQNIKIDETEILRPKTEKFVCLSCHKMFDQEVRKTNIQIIEAVKCGGVLTSVDKCIQCDFYLGRDEILQQILCARENKLPRKEEYVQQCKDYFGGIIEFGDKNE